MQELATVMMLSYNNIKYMKNAILSVLKQNYEKIELIIMDDSTIEFNDAFIKDIEVFIEKNKKKFN